MREKIWTQADIDAVQANEDGIKCFPAYSIFSAYCIFSEHCIFGNSCNFGACCNFGKSCGFSKSCVFGVYCYFGKSCVFGVYCHFGEYCDFSECCEAISPFWGFVYEPPLKTIGRIYPTTSTRDFWAEKLQPFGVIIRGRDCYDTIFAKVKPKAKEILECKNFTKCERRILASWLEDDCAKAR
jgi:hypothetical protein